MKRDDKVKIFLVDDDVVFLKSLEMEFAPSHASGALLFCGCLRGRLTIGCSQTAALLWARFARFYLMRLQLNRRR